MAQRIVARTRTDNVKPLGDPGQRSYDFIVGVVGRELSPRQAMLFAEPIARPDGVVWMTTAEGEITSYAALPPDEAAALRSELADIVETLVALADDYGGRADPAAQALSIALRNAVEIPNEECLFRVGPRQPVIVQWAHHLDVYNPPRGVLSRVVASGRPEPVEQLVAQPAEPTPAPLSPPQPQPPAPAAAVVAPSRPFDWLWWLSWALLGVLLWWLLTLAVPACGMAWPFGNNHCPEARAASDADEADALEREIAALEREIAEGERSCIAQGEEIRQAERAEAEQDPAPNEEPSIEEVIREQDETKLAGCWDLVSDLTLVRDSDGDGEPDTPVEVSEWSVCFDDQGKGSQTMAFEEGTTCRGTTTSSLSADKLTILDDAPMQCAGVNQGRVVARRTECRLGSGDVAECTAYVIDEPTRNSNVKLRRRR